MHHQVELVTLAPDLEHCPQSELPEVALSGRSNVGKSTLINLLLQRRKLARTSGNPGKTQTLVYYLVDERWHMVDMPGYGYAKVAQSQRRSWAAQMRRFLRERKQLAGVLQLIDLRVGVTPDDRERLRELLAVGVPFCIVMTKGDKVARTKQDATVAEHLGGLGLPPETGVVITSAKDGVGADELWAWMDDHVKF